MSLVKKTKSSTFNNFFNSEKSSGGLLIVCTLLSLAGTNSVFGSSYLAFWQTYVAGLSFEHWVNDGFMAIFFLLIGLELERGFYVGELSNFKNALLPIFAAIGGLSLPAFIHFSLNVGSVTQAGIGIPMATDIAFALGALALLGNRVPTSLKVLLTAIAVMDDLGAIIVIAIFYTAKLSVLYLIGALSVFGLLIVLNKLSVMSLIPYILGGVLMWFLMLKSGIHPTIAGVLLAFAIPFTNKVDDVKSPSQKLEHFLHKPVAFIILPIFACVNTGVVIGSDWFQSLFSTNSMGILLGLALGKPLGITLASLLVVFIGFCRLPSDLNWKHLIGIGILGGIGFTMSIFITNLAFVGEPHIINASKMAILLASLIAGIIGFTWLRLTTQDKSK
ncbi:MAG: Na+/H+ antiporter NhaA [Methylophilaceae bacterium]|nr:Na+/H+ antiporter NhaA [Methylophilaceae bacterium]